MSKEELIIPVRFVYDRAAADLKAVGAAGKAAGDATAQGARNAQHALEGTGKAAQGVGSELKTLIKAQMGLGAIKGLAGEIGDEWRRVADDIGKASREWQQFRQSLQGVAALEGKANSNKAAEAEIGRAERAHVTPEEAQKFRGAFLAKASLYVGNGPDAKMSAADADLFQERLMEYAKSKGVGQEEMAGFAGGLLAQQKGPTNAKEMMARAGKVFATLEASSAPVSHLLPGVTRVMAQGFSAEEAAPKLAMLPEIAPEEESTHLLGAIAQLRKARMEGKLEAFGVTDEMSPNQMFEKVVLGLNEKAGQGPMRGRKMDELLQGITHYHLAQDTLRGLANKGPEGLKTWRDLIERTPADVIDRTIAENRESDAGRQQAVESRLAVEKIRLGMRGDTVERRRQIAEAELTAGGQFEHVQFGQFPASLVPGADDMRSRMINLQAIRRARAELGEEGGLGDSFASLNKGATNDLLRTLIDRIEAQHKTQEETKEVLQRANACNAGAPPLPSAMPGGNARQ
jgi:hypothetical protein